MKNYIGSLGLNDQATPFKQSLKKVLSLLNGSIIDYRDVILGLNNDEMNFRMDRAIIVCSPNFLLERTNFLELPQKSGIVDSCHPIQLGPTMLPSLLVSPHELSYALSWENIAKYMAHIFDHIANDTEPRSRLNWFSNNIENIISFLVFCAWTGKLTDIAEKWKKLSGYSKHQKECANELFLNCNELCTPSTT